MKGCRKRSSGSSSSKPSARPLDAHDNDNDDDDDGGSDVNGSVGGRRALAQVEIPTVAVTRPSLPSAVFTGLDFLRLAMDADQQGDLLQIQPLSKLLPTSTLAPDDRPLAKHAQSRSPSPRASRMRMLSPDIARSRSPSPLPRV